MNFRVQGGMMQDYRSSSTIRTVRSVHSDSYLKESTYRNYDENFNTSLEGPYDQDDYDVHESLGSLRSYGNQQVEKRPHASGKHPSRSNSVKSNRSDGHLINSDYSDHEAVSGPENAGSASVSRTSSISRRSEPPIARSKATSAAIQGSRSYNYSAELTSSASLPPGKIEPSSQAMYYSQSEYSGLEPRSHSLPRQNGYAHHREESYQKDTHTIPRHHGPASTSTPEPPSEEVLEEERLNPDGSTVVVRRVVTATATHRMHEDDVPQVEARIRPATEILLPLSTFARNGNDRQFEQATTSSTYHNDDTYGTEFVDRNQHIVNDDVVSYRGNTGPLSKSNSVSWNTHEYHYSNDRVESAIAQQARSSGVSDTSSNDRNSNSALHGQSFGLREQDDVYVMEEKVIPENFITLETSAEDRTDFQQSSATSATMKAASTDVVAHNGAAFASWETELHMSTRPQSQSSESNLDEKKMKNGHVVDLLDLLMYLKTDDSVLKSNTAGYIMHLSYDDEKAKNRIRKLGIIPLLVSLLDEPDEDCHRNAAGALKNLSYGRFMNDNKVAIQEAGGVGACTRLLYRTSWIEVREHVTGVLYNLSSSESIKRQILDEAMEAVAVLIVIPLSGWDKADAQSGSLPGVVTWSALLRNSTGLLRNVSSAGIDARKKIRHVEGLVDALIWILKAALQQDKNDIDNKIVENCVCTLRNLSYHVDVEVSKDDYPDAVVQVAKDGAPSTDVADVDGANKPQKQGAAMERAPAETSGTGFFGMKKKPLSTRKVRGAKTPVDAPRKNSIPPPETEQFLLPVRDAVPIGVELIWQPSTVNIYVYLLKNSTNPVTLEASAAAIHNLCGCTWKWADLVRVHVRLQSGLPPMADLLNIDQEYVVRAVAYALQNLAINRRNKWSIGKYAMKEIVAVLPKVQTFDREVFPSDSTIVAVLSCMQILVHNDFFNSKYVCNEGGGQKLVALTREKDAKSEKPLRHYSQAVVLEANRVLLHMWKFKECRDAIKKETWSHSKAKDSERAYKNATLKQPENVGDSYAEMESDQLVILAGRDVIVDENASDLERAPGHLHPDCQATQSDLGHEMSDFGHTDAVAETQPLVKRNSLKKKMNWFSKTSSTKSKKKRNGGKKPSEESSALLNDGDREATKQESSV